jgi:hypothetical protein
MSIAVTTIICLFWTVPVTFVSSLSNIQVFREEVELVDKILKKAPALEPVFVVLAPQLLVLLNALLPIILQFATEYEGHISGSLVQASMFVKLAAFAILQVRFFTELYAFVSRLGLFSLTFLKAFS